MILMALGCSSMTTTMEILARVAPEAFGPVRAPEDLLQDQEMRGALEARKQMLAGALEVLAMVQAMTMMKGSSLLTLQDHTKTKLPVNYALGGVPESVYF